MFNLVTHPLPLLLFSSYPILFSSSPLVSAKAIAPPAHCYDSSNDGKPPPNISDSYVNDCGHKGLWFTGANYAGWTAYYDRTSVDLGRNVVTSCSDLAGDVRNLLAQCPHGGALYHQNPVNPYGMVFVDKIGGPNVPPVASEHYHGP